MRCFRPLLLAFSPGGCGPLVCASVRLAGACFAGCFPCGVGEVSEAVFGCLFRQCGCVGVCCSGCSSPVPCLLGGSSLHKVRGCPDCRRARRVSGAIAPLELALAVRCGPLVVTPAKSMQNLIITLRNHLSPNETPHTQTVVSPCICFQPKAMKPKTPWIYQQKSPIIS